MTRLVFLVPILCLLLNACQTQQQSSSRNQPPSNPQTAPAASMPTASSSQSGQRSAPSSASESRASAGAERSTPSSSDGGGAPAADSRDSGQSSSYPAAAAGASDQRVPDPGAAGGDASARADGSRRDEAESTGKTGSGETAGAEEEGSGAVTAGERMGELGGELNESLTVFDGMILNEREAIRGKASEEAGKGDGQADGPLFEEAALSEPGVTEPGGPAAGEEADTEPQEETVPAMPGGGNRRSGGPEVAEGRGDGGVPADIGDGSDDDIVARQIREAALAEEDPQLREKLWDEYRQYKNEQGDSE